ncbi:MAG: signal peptidase I, partial [Anaerolinea sp.]|nr:signal peptidase I [Anaerolinea sp.]
MVDDPFSLERAGPYFSPPAEVEYWDGWPAVPPEDATDVPASPRRSSRGRRFIRELVETSVLAILVFLSVRATFGTYSVEGRSMDPTLENGEFLLVNRLQYAKLEFGRLGSMLPFVGDEDGTRYIFGAPARGDVVILKDPRNPIEKDLVKRIIGLPGDVVEISDGHVYVNGRLLDEPYILGDWDGSKSKVVIPSGQYYVLGDNRRNSSDSRFFGLVPERLIEGRVLGSPWPPSKFGTNLGVRPTLADEVTRP